MANKKKQLDELLSVVAQAQFDKISVIDYMPNNSKASPKLRFIQPIKFSQKSLAKLNYLALRYYLFPYFSPGRNRSEARNCSGRVKSERLKKQASAKEIKRIWRK